MNATTITMDRDEAMKHYRGYKQHEDKLNYEQRVAMIGFQALSRGKELIDLDFALRNGGDDDQGRPKLAVARADWKSVRLQRYQGVMCFKNSEVPRFSGVYKQYRFNGCKPVRNEVNATAIVPIIPGRFIPRAPLDYFEILFEAEWRPAAPVDPILLRNLEGNLYVVLAKWDLTPLEQAALATRIR